MHDFYLKFGQLFVHNEPNIRPLWHVSEVYSQPCPKLLVKVSTLDLRSNVLKQYCSSAAASQLVQACKGILGSKHKKSCEGTRWM